MKSFDHNHNRSNVHTIPINTHTQSSYKSVNIQPTYLHTIDNSRNHVLWTLTGIVSKRIDQQSLRKGCGCRHKLKGF